MDSTTHKVHDATPRTGRVRTVKYPRGFGFVRSSGDDFFFHMTEFKNEEDFFTLNPADKISFILIEVPGGKIQAGQIEIVERKK